MTTPIEEVTWSDWATLDEDVRAEVRGILELCQDSSEMNESSHPKHDQYNRAILVAREILRTGTEGK